MALHNISSALQRIINTLGKTPAGQGVEVLSYKRNRGVSILKKEDGTFYVREHGYNEKVWNIAEDKLIKLLKSIIKREFPRSRKLRIYHISHADEINLQRKKL